MKRYLVLTVLALGLSVPMFAGGLDFHLGAGYSGSIMGKLPDSAGDAFKDITARPLGLGGYVGLGIGFGASKAVNLGVEFAPRWDISLKSPYLSGFGYQGRVYLKIKPIELLTITPFVGLGGDLIRGAKEGSFNQLVYVAGARVTLLFLYFEYAAQLQKDFSAISAHQIGFGVAFFR